MGRARSLALLGLALVAVAAVAGGWLRDVPDISGDDAVAATEVAFDDAGLAATVDPVATRRRYLSGRRPAVDVWTVRARVRDSQVDVLLARSGAQPVAIDDRTADGTAYALTDAEYRAVATGIDDLSLARAVERNVALTVAAALVVAVCLALAATSSHREETS